MQKIKRNSIFSFSLFVGFIVFSIFFLTYNHFWTAVNFSNIESVKIAGQSVKVELALNSVAQEQGLSGRQDLNENEGMLFVFDQSNQYSFWMKDMNFPIDIIWINENLKVVYIKKDARPESYPESYGPDTNAKYVLEVASGFSEKNNLKVGDSVLFTH